MAVNMAVKMAVKLAVKKCTLRAPEEWKMPESEQAPHKYRTSTGQVQDKLNTDNPNIAKLVQVIQNNRSIRTLECSRSFTCSWLLLA